MVCRKCQIERSPDAFYPTHKTCKECIKAYARKWNRDNKEHCQAYQRAYQRNRRSGIDQTLLPSKAIKKESDDGTSASPPQSFYLHADVIYHGRCERPLIFAGVIRHEEIHLWCSHCVEAVYCPVLAFERLVVKVSYGMRDAQRPALCSRR